MKRESGYRRLNQISFFKGVAILMILLCHATQKFDTQAFIHYFPKFCQMGCQIFFALSAFSLCLSMDRRNDSVKDFYKRRLLSIAPGYWISIAVYVGFGLFTEYVGGGGNFLGINTEPGSVGANFCLIHGLIPTEANNKVVKGGWYVGTLVILYLLFPLMRKLYEKCASKTNGLVFILVVQVVSFFLLASINLAYPSLTLSNNKFLYFSFINQLPCFCFGIWLYDLYKNGRINSVKHPLVKSITIGIIAFLLFFSRYHYSFIFEPGVFTIAFSYLFIYSLQKEKIVDVSDSKLNRIICGMGNNSYSIYLIHPLIVYTGTYLLNTFYNTGLLVYVLWLPASLFIVYYVSIVYGVIIEKFQSIIRQE